MKALFLTLFLLCQISYADTTHEVLPIADTYVTSEQEQRNFGSESILDLKTYYAGTRVLIKFDKDELINLTNDKDIVSARLELPIQNHYVNIPGQIGLHKMNVNWTENGATWKCPVDSNPTNYNQDCANPWLMWSHDPNNTIAYPYDLSPFSIGTIIGEQSVPVGFDLKNYVTDLISGNIVNNFGFAVFKNSTNINDPLAFYSRDSDVGPKLILVLKDRAPVSNKVIAKIVSNLESGSVPLAVHFDASQSKAKTGSSIQKIELDLGNGYFELDKMNPVKDFSYNTEGDFQAILKVTDSSGDFAYDVLNISVLGDETNNLDKNYGYWINFPENLNVKYANGQQGNLSGDVCKIWKTQNKGGDCQWVDKQKLKIQAYFPDMTTEVSSLLNVTTTNNRRAFNFQTPVLNKNNINVLTLIVGEIDTQSIQVSALKSKLEMRIMILDQKILDYQNQGIDASIISALQEVRTTLITLCDKIDNRNAKLPSILAQYNLPLQVDNRVSSSRYYSTMVGGFRFELSSDIGNLIQGDYATIKSRVTNLNFTPDNTQDLEGYNFKYSYKGSPLTVMNRSSFSKGSVQEYTYQDPSRSNLNAFHSFGVVVEEKFKWWARNLGGTEFSMPVLEDTSVPYWVNPKSEVTYATQLPIFTEKAIDDFGRLDRNSFKATISGEVEADISSKFSFESSSKSTDLTVRADLMSLYQAEGDYEVKYSISDFTPHSAIPTDYIRKYHIDRSSPFILLPFTELHATNQQAFEVPFTLADLSTTTLKIIVNGHAQVDLTLPEGGLSDTATIDLVEGINLVTVQATDVVGNTMSINYPPIFLDTIAPTLAGVNLVEGQIVRLESFNLIGSSNEVVKSVIINGVELDLGTTLTNNFSYAIEHAVAGPQRAEISLVDVAGNKRDFGINYTFLLKILDANLISVLPNEAGGLTVTGQPGAAKPGVEVEVSSGLFNSSEATASDDGSFRVEMDPFTTAKVSAYDAENDFEDEVTISYNVDSTFAGIVKDNQDLPLPGVTITMVSSGQKTITDSQGVFKITNPILGDQVITVDGTTIPGAVTNGTKEFSKMTVNVNLGKLQQNVLERPLYLTPKYLDGTETPVEVNQVTVVESEHAPGVRLEIPANAAIFPGGSREGTINMTEISVDKTSVEILEEAKPDTVIALEPSGLKFSERVNVTLPNVNEFPEGMELAILSKNSDTGEWEIDGAATVNENGDIETKEGMGISHFSEIFAAPMGLEIKSFSDGDKPSIDSFNGAVTTSVNLPSFKVMGQDIAPSLNYNSNWANPNVVISNMFNLPSQKIVKKDSVTGGSFFGVGKGSATLEQYITPEYIDARFSSSTIVSNPIRFTGLPNKALVSYQMNLGELPSGIYPAKSSYEIRYKHLTITTTKTKTRNLLGQVKTTKKRKTNTGLMEAIFPPELLTSLYIQNKTKSEYGSGWHLGLTKRILNPGQDRLLLENEQGGIAPYVIKNTLETVVYNAEGIDTFSVKGNQIVYSKGKDVFYSQNNQVTSGPVIPALTATVGVNLQWYWRRYDGRNWWYCEKSKFTEQVKPDISEILNTSQGMFFLDAFRGTLTSYNGSVFATLNNNLQATPKIYLSSGNPNRTPQPKPDIQSLCKSYFNHECTNATAMNLYDVRNSYNEARQGEICDFGDGDTRCNSGSCVAANAESSGLIHQLGFNTDNRIEQARFNTPKAMAAGPNGTLLIVDYGNNTVRQYNPASGALTLFAGNRTTTDLGMNGLAINASIVHPSGIATDSLGNVYISTENGFIRKIGTDGVIREFAGKNIGGILDDGANFNEMLLSKPSGMVVDNENQYLYVADTGHHRVMRLDLINGDAKVVAGNYTCVPGDTTDGKSALNVSLCSPEKIALDADKNLLILDEINNRIRKVNFQSPTSGQIRYAPVAKNNSEIIKNSDGSFILKLRDGSETLFSNQGLQTSTIDRAGRVVGFNYDSENRLLKMVLPTHQEIVLNYSGEKISSITNPDGRITEFEFDGEDLSQVDYPDGTTRSFAYREDGILTRDTNQRGFTTEYELNQWNRLKKVIRPDGTFISMDDAISKTIANNSTENNPAELLSYGSDQDSLKDIMKDAKGNNTAFLKDSNGYVQTIVDATGKTTTVERDGEGRPTKIIKPDLTYTQLTYNQSTGDLLQRYESASNTTENYTYNSYGQLLSYTDPLSRTKILTYDLQSGFLLRETDPNGNYTDYTYNALGLIQATSNALGNKVSYTYDTAGNVEKSTSPMGESSIFTRDGAGNVLSRTNAKGQTVIYTYDVLNRLKTVKTPGNLTTTYNYSASGELEEILNPAGFSTLYEYDQLDRLVKKTSPSGQVSKMFYDDNDNVIKEISPHGDNKIYEYDEFNKLTKKTLPDNVYQFEYNDNGKLILASNNSSAVEMTYVSILGRDHLKTISASATDVPNYTMTYGYNGSGKVVTMTSGYMNMTYSLDQAYRINGVQNSLGQTFNFGYDNANRLTSILRPGAVNSTLAYDNNNFLTGYVHKQSSTTIESLIYTRDQIGNRTSLTTLHGTHLYTYDDNGQLKTSSHPEADALHRLESFTYDSLGNRITDNQGNYSYDNKKIRLEEDYKHIYVYDLNGNLVSKQERGLSGKTWNYSYSSENQLLLVEFFNGSSKLKSVAFTYDVQGRRIKKTVNDLQNSKSYERKFIYNGNEIIAELNEDDDVLAKYTHSGLQSDDLLAVEITSEGVNAGLSTATGTYLFLKDGLGSIQSITNASGNIIQRYVYSSFGKLLKLVDSSGTEISPIIQTSYSYANREYDIETGLYYYRARYYDPNSGRFMQEDPHAGVLEMPGTFNSAYSYGLNNPIFNTDPSGRILPIVAAMIVGALIGGTMNAILNKGNFVENFLVGAVAGAVAGAVGYGVGLAIGGTGSLLGAIGKGAAVGALSSGAATTTSILIKGGDVTSSDNLGRIGLSMLIGGIVGGAIGGASWNRPAPVKSAIEKGGQVQGETIDAGSQKVHDYIINMRSIECAPFINRPSDYQTCMGN